MKLTTALVAALGLLTSVTVALPTTGDATVSDSTGLKARSAEPLGIQGTIMNYLPHGSSPDPRKDLKHHNDKQRPTGLEARSAEPLGIQGTIMNYLAHGSSPDPRKDPKYHNDKQRRAIDTTTEVASKDTEYFSITLCNKINHGGTCVKVPMTKNGCQSFPLLVNTRSLYMELGTTQCWVFNNEECHMTGDINDLWIWRWIDTDDLQAADRPNLGKTGSLQEVSLALPIHFPFTNVLSKRLRISVTNTPQIQNAVSNYPRRYLRIPGVHRHGPANYSKSTTTTTATSAPQEK
ncbi:hypothetical protein BLS_005884 [Venturia inaequalis]|uniref:Uncharacterized protein n=1 Tax=Venturia inaequalis TaxID=5025 RepID=A0A8H3UD83_VENIN|nr:hypothetical protein BLS_005884 [Venturia inaequalis]